MSKLQNLTEISSNFTSENFQETQYIRVRFARGLLTTQFCELSRFLSIVCCPIKCLFKNLNRQCFLILSHSYFPHNKKCLVAIMKNIYFPHENDLPIHVLRCACSSKISVKIRSGPAEVNFQPIPACDGSISVSDTVLGRYQG